jgi:hypothetical protein
LPRTRATSPFTPGYGVVPQVFAGREGEFADFEDALVPRVTSGVYEAARLVTGERGMGKTALLREMGRWARDAGHWTVHVTATRAEPTLPRLAETILATVDAAVPAHKMARTTLGALRRLTELRAGVVGVGLAEAGTRSSVADELSRGLVEAAELADRADKAMIVFIDEAQNVAKGEVGTLFAALQTAQTHERDVAHPTGARLRLHPPLAVYGAGLPGLVAHIKQSGSTFAERSRHLRLGPLSDSAVTDALMRSVSNAGVTFETDALALAVAAVTGYPYFLHVVGESVWAAGDGEVITVAEARAGVREAQGVIADFYGERLRDLTDAQLAYLRAAASLDERDRTSGGVAKVLGATSDRWGSTQQRLIDVHGLLRRESGHVVFTLPGLDRYLARSSR